MASKRAGMEGKRQISTTGEGESRGTVGSPPVLWDPVLRAGDSSLATNSEGRTHPPSLSPAGNLFTPNVVTVIEEESKDIEAKGTDFMFENKSLIENVNERMDNLYFTSEPLEAENEPSHPHLHRLLNHNQEQKALSA